MPFKFVSKLKQSTPKQTIDVENANKLLDIYDEYSNVIDKLYDFINESRNSQTLYKTDLIDLIDINTQFKHDNSKLWSFTIRYIDQAKIKNIVFKRGENNHDI